MLSKRFLNMLAIVLMLALVLPAAPAQASALPQGKPPVANRHCPPIHPEQLQDEAFMQSLPPECLPGAQTRQTSETFQQDAANLPVPMASGGPDSFGYTWDNSVAYTWVDTSGGTNVAFSGTPSNYTSIPVTLPFTFKYYENSYSSLRLVPWGYLSFNDSAYWPEYESIPFSGAPNNLIAPYMSWLYYDAGSWLHYQTFGSAPNRYFVAEWHNVKGGPPSDTIGGDDTFTFSVTLWENGNIDFQYQSMDYSGGNFRCANSGIEDSRGLDGLSPQVNNCAPSTADVRFSRPALAARSDFTPRQQGELAAAGVTKTFTVAVRNIGDLGSDTFDLTTSSVWPVTLFATDGVTWLTDTDGDTTIDTGPIAQGATHSFMAKIIVPGAALTGDTSLTNITATSSVNIGVTKTIGLSLTVPAKFVGVFEDQDNGAMSFMTASPSAINNYKATANFYDGSEVATAQTATGSYLYAWNKNRILGSDINIYEIEYAIVGQNGSLVRPVSKLTDLSAVTTDTYDYSPSVAVAPDGRMGVTWKRVEYDNATQNKRANIYFAILDAAGGLSYGPLNITNHAMNASAQAYYPTITATDDNRFLVSWDLYDWNIGNHNIWLAGYASNGINVIAPHAISTDNDSWGQKLNPLPGGLVILTSVKSSGGPYYSILNSSSGVVKAETNLASNMWVNSTDAVALRDGKVALAWVTNTGINLNVLSAAYLPTVTVTANNVSTANGNTGLSLTTDTAGRVIMTWLDGSFNTTALYAMANKSGTFLVQPQIYKTSQSYLDVGWGGQGTAPLNIFGDVKPTYWAAPWIEGLSAAGITGGCGVGTYCPVTQVTRAQMAVFLLKGMGITPPAATGTKFPDVPGNYWAASWVEELANQGITAGCGGGNFCPDAIVTREQMAVFLLKAKNVTPIAATGTRFTDVPLTHWAAKWVEELARQGITSGCSATEYCPGTAVTRDQMAIFLVRTFNLPFEAPLP